MTLNKNAATLAMLWIFAAFGAPATDVDYGAPVELAMSIGTASPSRCNVVCADCDGGKHTDIGQGVPAYSWRAEKVHPNECEGTGSCAGAHTQKCQSVRVETVDFANTEENYDAIRKMVATGELEELAAVLDTDWVSYVAERRSIQVQNCTGTIIANFPVRREWAVVLDSVDDVTTVATQ